MVVVWVVSLVVPCRRDRDRAQNRDRSGLVGNGVAALSVTAERAGPEASLLRLRGAGLVVVCVVCWLRPVDVIAIARKIATGRDAGKNASPGRDYRGTP